jgi:hypothetical protein
VSYDIELLDEQGKVLHLSGRHTRRGGTYEMGGSTRAWLNVTYNYSKFYYEHIDPEKGIRLLYGMKGSEAAPILKSAIEKLGTERDEDYWAETPGNAGAALQDLLLLIMMSPIDPTIDGD